MAGYSPLFQAANKRIQASARQQFRRSNVGQLLTEFERLQNTKPGRIDLAKMNRSLIRFSRQGILSQLKRTGIGSLVADVERYARGSGTFGGAGFEALYKALGPLGGLVRSLMGIAGSRRTGLSRELDSAISLLRSFGFEVLPPGGRGRKRGTAAAKKFLEDLGYTVAKPPQEQDAMRQRLGQIGVDAPASRPLPKRVSIDTGGAKPKRVATDDPLVTGEQILVERSTNVYGFSYDLANGTLYIQFLGGRGDQRKGPGATYAYSSVPPAIFQRMRRAASKGNFIWDHIRVRGTVTGHRFDYRLHDIAGGYVPRKATLLAGGEEWYIRREFRKAGKVYRSGLADQFVQRIGQPNRGGPNRGRPNRGAPNRGR